MSTPHRLRSSGTQGAGVLPGVSQATVRAKIANLSGSTARELGALLMMKESPAPV